MQVIHRRIFEVGVAAAATGAATVAAARRRDAATSRGRMVKRGIVVRGALGHHRRVPESITRATKSRALADAAVVVVAAERELHRRALGVGRSGGGGRAEALTAERAERDRRGRRLIGGVGAHPPPLVRARTHGKFGFGRLNKSIAGHVVERHQIVRMVRSRIG